MLLIINMNEKIDIIEDKKKNMEKEIKEEKENMEDYIEKIKKKYSINNNIKK